METLTVFPANEVASLCECYSNRTAFLHEINHVSEQIIQPVDGNASQFIVLDVSVFNACVVIIQLEEIFTPHLPGKFEARIPGIYDCTPVL